MRHRARSVRTDGRRSAAGQCVGRPTGLPLPSQVRRGSREWWRGYRSRGDAGFRRAGADPDGVADRAAFFRSKLAGSRVLVVLDNAAGEAQVRPLLPGALSCGVLVTSRARLSGLEGARPVHLDVLDERAAVELLGTIAGGARVAAEPKPWWRSPGNPRAPARLATPRQRARSPTHRAPLRLPHSQRIPVQPVQRGDDRVRSGQPLRQLGEPARHRLDPHVRPRGQQPDQCLIVHSRQISGERPVTFSQLSARPPGHAHEDAPAGRHAHPATPPSPAATTIRNLKPTGAVEHGLDRRIEPGRPGPLPQQLSHLGQAEPGHVGRAALAGNFIRAGQTLHTMTSTPSTHGWQSHGKMTDRAAATGPPRPHQHHRPTPPTPDDRSGQGHRDLGVAPPDALLQRQLGDTRVRLSPTDRAILAALVHQLPRQTLHKLRLLVHPDTILRWHRDLLADATRRCPDRNAPADPAPSDPSES